MLVPDATSTSVLRLAQPSALAADVVYTVLSVVAFVMVMVRIVLTMMMMMRMEKDDGELPAANMTQSEKGT